MTDPGLPEPNTWGQPPNAVAGRFILRESSAANAPRTAQGLRDWWWSGTRPQRWSAALGAPLSLLLLLSTCSGPGADDPGQASQLLATATRTTTERPPPETTTSTRTPTPTLTQSATVLAIVDGDTIQVSRDGRAETVRLIGIDAPESAASATGLQCWAVESTAFASATLLQQQVLLVVDPSQGVVDGFGRTLSYVLLPDGRDFSVLSVTAGHARNYTFTRPAAKIAEISAAEQAARAAGAGLWGPPCNGGVTFPVPVAAPPPPPPRPPPPPPPDSGTDPRFGTCREAIANGYGDYVAGVDPEYAWYDDRDNDGIVCER